jgi:hypothetical protein
MLKWLLPGLADAAVVIIKHVHLFISLSKDTAYVTRKYTRLRVMLALETYRPKTRKFGGVLCLTHEIKLSGLQKNE